MRFLCLHGRGTNSDIFESQLAPLTSKLSQPHTFDFVDASHSCLPFPGVGDVYPPPYLTYHFHHSVSAIQAAHDEVRDIIEEEEPYDGVIAFSQAAAVAIGLMVVHQLTNPNAPPLFKMAVFICSAPVLSPSTNIGIDMTQTIRSLQADDDACRTLQVPLEVGSVTDDLDHTLLSNPSSNSSSSNFSKASSESSPPSTTTSERSNRSSPQSFGLHPSCFDQTYINIPTVHILGSKDPYREYGIQATRLCDRKSAKIFYHNASHELPRLDSEMKACAELIDMTVASSY